MQNNKEFTIFSKHSKDNDSGIYRKSEAVKSFESCLNTAVDMVDWLNENNGHFDNDQRMAYAVSHCQVVSPHSSFAPKAFFVVAKDFVNDDFITETRLRNKTNFYFPAQAIFNARVVEAPEKLEKDIPKREVVTGKDGKVTTKIKLVKGMVNNRIGVPDACMSFPNKSGKTMERFYRIKVKYQTRWHFGLLRPYTEWVEGVKAHVFQHEIDHANGINIYYSNK